MANQHLFNILDQQHGIIALETEMAEIIAAVDKDRACSIMVCQACGHQSTDNLCQNSFCCVNPNWLPLKEFIAATLPKPCKHAVTIKTLQSGHGNCIHCGKEFNLTPPAKDAIANAQPPG